MLGNTGSEVAVLSLFCNFTFVFMAFFVCFIFSLYMMKCGFHFVQKINTCSDYSRVACKFHNDNCAL